MKSCLGILIVFSTFVAVVGGGALIWYLSTTVEFSRADGAPATDDAPKAQIVSPAPRPAPGTTPPRRPNPPPKPRPAPAPAPAPAQPSNPFGDPR